MNKLNGIVLQVSALVTSVAIADSNVVNGVTWRYSENESGITLCCGTPDEWGDCDGGRTIDDDVTGDIVVPAEINGLSVTAIGNGAFGGCRMITSIRIPATVERIGHDAFRGCTALTNIVLSEGLQSVHHSAFGGCPLLERLVLPNSLRDVEYGRIDTTAEIELKPDHPKYKIIGDAVYDKRGMTLVDIFGHSKRIVIPAGVKRIGERAFSESEVEAVELPETLEEIGVSAFENCEGLVVIDIPEKVRKIKSNAFEGCRSLTGVFYHGPRCEIADDSFARCGLVVSFVRKNMHWENAAGVLAGCRHRNGDLFENEYWDGNLGMRQKLESVIRHLTNRKDVESVKVLALLYGSKTLPTYDPSLYFTVLSETAASSDRRDLNWRMELALAWIRNRLGLCYRDGIGCDINVQRARYWFSESEMPESFLHMAEMIMASATTDEARDAAFGLALASAKRGYWYGGHFAKVYIQLGNWCLERKCPNYGKPSDAVALEMFQKAMDDRSISQEDIGCVASRIRALQQSQTRCQ